MPTPGGDGLEQMTREELIRECRNKQSLINFLNKPEPEPLPPQMLEALDITREEVAAQVATLEDVNPPSLEAEALALLRELNDICWGVIPSDLQARVDAILDRADEHLPQNCLTKEK